MQTADALSGAEIIQIVAGGGISAALLSNGTVWTWGDNFFGVLGDGSTGVAAPRRVRCRVSAGSPSSPSLTTAGTCSRSVRAASCGAGA
jgi:alpha-tubulin suppressor-like RCC1 family protein